MTFKQIEAFVCVVDMGSFRRAATVLGTTQPNISNRISSLEQILGVVLMHRDASAVRLTEKGKVLLASAREVLWSAEAFMESAERQDLIADRMRLGVTELVACTWLHEFLRRFRGAYPSVVIELQVNLSVEIEKEMAAGQIDLALQTGPFRYETPESLPLATCPYVWVAAPERAREIGHGETIARLLQSPVLTHARHSQASRELAQLAAGRRLTVENIVYSNNLASCVQLAIDAMGAALLPEPLVRQSIAAGQLMRLTCDWAPPPLEFFARFDRAKAPRFVEVAAQFAIETAGLADKLTNS